MGAKALQRGIQQAYWDWNYQRFCRVIGANGSSFVTQQNYQAFGSLYAVLMGESPLCGMLMGRAFLWYEQSEYARIKTNWLLAYIRLVYLGRHHPSLSADFR